MRLVGIVVCMANLSRHDHCELAEELWVAVHQVLWGLLNVRTRYRLVQLLQRLCHNLERGGAYAMCKLDVIGSHAFNN